MFGYQIWAIWHILNPSYKSSKQLYVVPWIFGPIQCLVRTNKQGLRVTKHKGCVSIMALWRDLSRERNVRDFSIMGYALYICPSIYSLCTPLPIHNPHSTHNLDYVGYGVGF